MCLTIFFLNGRSNGTKPDQTAFEVPGGSGFVLFAIPTFHFRHLIRKSNKSTASTA